MRPFSNLPRRLGIWSQITGSVFLLLMFATTAFGQFENKVMAVGEMDNAYTETGAQQEYWWSGYGLEWPAITNQSGHLRADAFWIAADNVKDADGKTWSKRVVHVGTRATGAGEFFPQGFKTISRFEPPQVTVDGLPSYDKIVDNDSVDPNLPADRVIETKVNTLLGATLTKRIYGWSQGYNDNYHIQEYIITNTGNVNDDPEQELDQTLNGVYIHFMKRYDYTGSIVGSGWGANVMNDIVGDGHHDYGVNFRAQYTWLGNSLNSPYDPLGAPIWDAPSWSGPADTSGRLSEPAFLGTVTLHADSTADITDNAVSQPSMTGHLDADDPLTSANDAFNESKMQREYDFVSEARGTPHMWPHQADIVDSDGDFTTADGDPMLGKPGGWQSAFSYGPYTLKPGDDVRIVIAEAADGLSMQMAIKVGRQWKQDANSVPANADPADPITLDVNGTPVTMNKNHWWFSGRDSLFRTFQNAVDHYNAGALTDFNSIPEPPLPPKTFDVASGVDKIHLEWSAYDSGPTRTAWIVYRTRNRYQGAIEDDWQYVAVDTLAADATSWDDTNVTRGIEYYYYLSALGDPADNTGGPGTPAGVALKSNRYYAQTYQAAALKREPGSALPAVRVVPNPYNLGAVKSLRWPDVQDKLGFLDLPGYCKIKIFTELGELIKTIDHMDGSGDDFWDLQTYAQQLVVSGMYFAVVQETDQDGNPTGNQITRKIIIIR